MKTSWAQSKSRAHVYLSSNFWDGLWIIQQPIANEIAKEEPVLYVERFVSVFTVLRFPRLWGRLVTWLRGARRVSPRLRLLAPLPLFHLGHRVPWLFRFEFVLQRWWIKWWARRDLAAERVLWLDNPLYECAVGRMGERLAVYHVADEISAFPTSHPEISRVLERTTLGKVNVVFAAAQCLAADKRQWQQQTYTVWNAIDTEAFGHELPQADLTDIERIPNPRVAFVGVLDEWVDVELLVLVATRLSHVHFVIVGLSNIDDQALRVLRNVHFLGRRDRLVVPGILRKCSASLVPFKKSRLTERLVPLKVFEALAAGIIPVCTDFSTDLDSLQRDGFALIGRTTDAFVAAVERAITDDSAALRDRLSSFGLRQTWRERWMQMNRVITQYLAASAAHSTTPPAETF